MGKKVRVNETQGLVVYIMRVRRSVAPLCMVTWLALLLPVFSLALFVHGLGILFCFSLCSFGRRIYV